MQPQKAPLFTFSIVAIILSVVLYRQFDFKTWTFEKPALAVVYIFTLAFALYILIKNYRNKAEK